MPDAIKKILVVAAHPDDEMLGCGGTLARFLAQGAQASILLLGEGPLARRSGTDAAQERAHAQACARKAAAALGIEDVRFGSLPDNRFDSLPLLDLTRIVEAIAQEVLPDTVFTHHAGDLNIDHRLTHQAVMTAFRPLPGTSVRNILGFEVLSSTEYAAPGTLPAFLPNLYVNIEGFLEVKQRALAAYTTEMRSFPHPRSHEAVEHLARLRGCQSGYAAAESFMIFRSIMQ